MDKRNLSYDDLMGNISQAELSQLATDGMLSDATLERCTHIGRFMQRVSSACPNPNLKVRDVLLRPKSRRCGKRPRYRLRTLGAARCCTPGANSKTFLFRTCHRSCNNALASWLNEG